MLDYYTQAQYGPFLKKSPTDSFEDFYQSVVTIARECIDSDTRALDIGCATGRLVFEYASLGALKACGTETSDAFIHFCESLEKGAVAEVTYPIPSAGIEFMKDDICRSDLPNASFDFISCLNVLDRVTNPTAALASIERIITPGGILLFADPYDWELSPAPKALHITDIKNVLHGGTWEICNEKRLVYKIPTGKNSFRDYDCHLIVARKRF